MKAKVFACRRTEEVAALKRVSLDELLGKRSATSYAEQHRFVMGLLEAGRIKPLKRSGTNGKKPALHLEYWLADEAPDHAAYQEELLYHTTPRIDVDYYLRHLAVYEQERAAVRAVHEFLREGSDGLLQEMSFNERSFQIWGEEKFLLQGAGKTVWKHCGFEMAELNCYKTAEPFSYYAHHRRIPQKILVVENKDTFFSMRRHLLEGARTLLGEEIGTLVYGAGKRVVSSFREFSLSAEPYMKEAANELLYFGDLDYEGIGIYENLSEALAAPWEIRPFAAAYLAMLRKGDGIVLPQTKERQNRKIAGDFFTCFKAADVLAMKRILEAGRYIPQEILHMEDF